MNDDTHRQPFAVEQRVDFTALDLLAGVVTDLVVSTAPFSADLTDWLLTTAADGLASRPVRSRKAMCKIGPDRLPDAITLEFAKDVAAPGSAVPAAPIPHPSDHSDNPRPFADEADGAPPSRSLFAITVSPIAGESCHSARSHKLLGQLSEPIDAPRRATEQG
jgi:hypothetical protein